MAISKYRRSYKRYFIAAFVFAQLTAVLGMSLCNKSTRTATTRREVLLSSLFPLMVQPGNALTPEEAATAYDSYASSYDNLDGGVAASWLGIEEARQALFSKARGRVLEIGAGTGLNINRYDTQRIEQLTLVDISDGMLKEAEKRVLSNAALTKVPIQYVKADATSELTRIFGEHKFDTVVDSFSLCVMGEKGAKNCLDQMSQVVKRENENGRVLLLENTRSSNDLLGFYQDITSKTAADMGGKGCIYNQDVTSLIRSTPSLKLLHEELYVSGVFRSFECVVS